MSLLKNKSIHEKLSISQFFDEKFAKFVVIGFSNFLISYSIFWISYNYIFGTKYKAFISQLLSYGLATIWSFLWNRRYTFKSTKPIIKQALRFISLQVSLAISSAFLISFGVDFFNFNPSLTWFAVMSVVTVINFLLSKWWAFNK